ncbi:MAG TPA: trypsin-like peptidase domain-containing protein [Roseiarcus sp.]
MNVAVKVMRLGCVALAAALASTGARAQSADADLKSFAVHVNRTPQQSWPGYGIYLGNGLILTASHVPGTFAATKPHVVIAGQDLPAGLVREGNLDSVDLTLLSIDPTGLPVRLRMRRMPLCERAPYAGEAVVVAIPEGTARSRVLPPQAIPAELRGRFGTVIGDVATTGNSGSGVFDAADFCLLGIISRKISVGRPSARFDVPVTPARDIAKYFVPAPVIKAFIPPGVTF